MTERLADVGEFGLIERLNSILGPQNLAVGIGDDAAVIALGEDALLATIDMQVQDVHFRLEEISAYDLGRRVLAVNVSDIAAMGGIPTTALVSLALPSDLATSVIEHVYRGLAAEAARFGVAVAGGNVSRTSGPLVIDLALLGRTRLSQVVKRSGARPGDVLAVTGFLGTAASARLLLERPGGDASASDRSWVSTSLVPEPRVSTGLRMASTGVVSAMLDISDGLAADLHHLCSASGVGAHLDAVALPVDPRVLNAAETCAFDALELALFGGEDYELLCAIPPGAWESLPHESFDVELHRIGTVLPAEEGIQITLDDGRLLDLEARGWRHF